MRRAVVWTILAGLIVSFAWMRGHSRSPRNFLVFNGLALFVAPTSMPTSAWFLNAQLDSSPVTAHETTVVSKHSYSGRSLTRRTIRFHSLYTPGAFGSLEIPSQPYAAVQPGDTIRINTRAGRFGWMWVESVERVAGPPTGG